MNKRWSGSSASCLLRRLAHDPRSLTHAERPQLEPAPGRARTTQFPLAAVLFFIAFARGLEIDAKKRRTDNRKNDR